MKIVLIGPVFPYRGGIAHFTSRLQEELQKSCHKIDVISYSKMYPGFLYPGKTDKDQSKQFVKIPAEFILNPIDPFSWIITLRKIKDISPDIVLIQWWTTFFAFSNWYLTTRLSKLNIPTIYIIHNVLPHEPKFLDLFLTKFAFRSAKGFITQSPTQIDLLRNYVKSKKILYSPHPVYDQFNSQNVDRKTARAKLNISKDEFVLLFFGIVRPYKGLKYLIRAVADVLSKGGHIKLLIAGEFWEKEQEYQKFISDLGISNSVFIDNRYIPNEEIPFYFSAADTFVAPYIGGTQSGALKIAMAFNLPMIISRSIATDPWMEVERDLCSIIDPVDISAFSKAIEDKIILKKRSQNQDLESSAYPNPKWNDFVNVIENFDTNLRTSK